MNRRLTAGTTADIVISLIPNVRLRRRQFGSHFLRRFFATIDAAICAIGRWLVQPPGTRVAVVTLMSIHAGLLAYSATRHGPTYLEPAFLASGLSQLHTGRFGLYDVNPPLPRVIAAMPVLAIGCKTDWHRYDDAPGARAEFAVGDDFLAANGDRACSLIVYARWSCIPFSLLGAYSAFRWATGLYGRCAGLLALSMWTLEPNLLAHAELVTPDCACWSAVIVAGYTFWLWLRCPSRWSLIIAGLALGFAQLTKLTCLALWGLWPVLWGLWLLIGRHDLRDVRRVFQKSCHLRNRLNQNSSLPTRSAPPLIGLVGILVLSVYVLNFGYFFEGTGRPLREYSFVSSAMTGLPVTGVPGNRFRVSCVGTIPIPLPAPYLRGIDLQLKDFESYEHLSYLRGQWSEGGWWYYYLYGLAVKVPCSVLLMAFLQAALVLIAPRRRMLGRDELVLLLPGLSIMLTCCLHPDLNDHLRYSFPALAVLVVWLGQWHSAARRLALRLNIAMRSHTRRFARVAPFFATLFLLLHLALSTLTTVPDQLSYFNEIAGGRSHGWRHLLGSSFDWGQDIMLLATDAKSNDWKIRHFVTDHRGKDFAAALGLPEHEEGAFDVFSIAYLQRVNPSLLKQLAAIQCRSPTPLYLRIRCDKYDALRELIIANADIAQRAKI